MQPCSQAARQPARQSASEAASSWLRSWSCRERPRTRGAALTQPVDDQCSGFRPNFLHGNSSITMFGDQSIAYCLLCGVSFTTGWWRRKHTKSDILMWTFAFCGNGFDKESFALGVGWFPELCQPSTFSVLASGRELQTIAVLGLRIAICLKDIHPKTMST